MKEVVTSLYLGCDTEKEPQIVGVEELSAFQNQQIYEEDIAFESTSEKIAVTNALLRVTFTPTSGLPAIGKISIQVPAWYAVSKDR